MAAPSLLLATEPVPAEIDVDALGSIADYFEKSMAQFVFLDDLPKGNVGTTLRRELRGRVCAAIHREMKP